MHGHACLGGELLEQGADGLEVIVLVETGEDRKDDESRANGARPGVVADEQQALLGPAPLDDVPGRRHGNAADPLVGELLARFGVAALRARAWPSLSGGEQQRVQLARVLAQVWDTPGPRLLLLDESTSALDPARQYRVLEELAALAEQGDYLIVLVCHDLNLANAFASRVLMLDQGRLLADDVPARVLTPERLAAVYGLRSRWLTHPDGPVLHVEGAL